MPMFEKLFARGVRTSEFWVTVITSVVVLLNALFDLNLDAESIVAFVLNNFAYVTSRAYLKGKAAEPVPPDAVIQVDGAPPIG